MSGSVQLRWSTVVQGYLLKTATLDVITTWSPRNSILSVWSPVLELVFHALKASLLAITFMVKVMDSSTWNGFTLRRQMKVMKPASEQHRSFNTFRRGGADKCWLK